MIFFTRLLTDMALLLTGALFLSIATSTSITKALCLALAAWFITFAYDSRKWMGGGVK